LVISTPVETNFSLLIYLIV